MVRPNPIPAGMHTVTPHLVHEDCARAIEFYVRAFGAEEVMRMPSPDGRKIWHCELRIGDSVVYLSDEMPGGAARAPSRERPATASIWLYVEDCDAAYQRAMRAGARSVYEPMDAFWGDRMGMVVDPFGYPWAMATHVRDLTEAEIRRAGEQWSREQGMGAHDGL